MTYLLADVGGTNTRLALADPTGLRPASITRFRNDTFASFDKLLARYLSDCGTPDLEVVCIAIAGPVHGSDAQLTNRNWAFHNDQIATLSGTKHVFLINDLSALAQALPRLKTELLCGPDQRTPEGQSLVIGMGTGFNVSPAKADAKGNITVFSAEMGHASLPVPVLAKLQSGLPEAASLFHTVEDCFCGPGLERLIAATCGQNPSGTEIMQRFADNNDPQLTQGVLLFASALGVFSRELIYHYMPRAGMIFAGSVAVSLLRSPARAAFLRSFQTPSQMRPLADAFPVSLITDDTAALWGCLDHIASQI